MLHALSDPTRREIVLKLLESGRMSCARSCEGLPPSTISFHHRVLWEAGLIRSRKVGVEVINTVRKAEIDRRFPRLLDAVLKNHGSKALEGDRWNTGCSADPASRCRS